MGALTGLSRDFAESSEESVDDELGDELEKDFDGSLATEVEATGVETGIYGAGVDAAALVVLDPPNTLSYTPPELAILGALVAELIVVVGVVDGFAPSSPNI